MRLASFLRPDGSASFGLVQADHVTDCGAALAATYADLRAVLTAGGLDDLAKASETADTLPLAEVTLLSPIPQPDKILCVGLNYLAHILEGGRTPAPYPAIFTRYPSSVVGHGQPLERPSVSTQFDYEGELALVIGKPGRYIKAKDAYDHIAGYTCFNDGSIRDFQTHTSQFWPGKSFHHSGSVGPWIVTRHDLPRIEKSHLRTILNGEEMQSTSISDLAIGIPEIIAYLSQVSELLPGDIIATGTPGGVGKYRTPSVYMKAGDVVEVEITGIGSLVNPVVDGA